MTAARDPSFDLHMRVMMVLALVASTGCSAMAVRGPRTTPAGRVVCDSQYVPPAIDAAIAVAGAAMIGYGIATRDDDMNTDGHRHVYDKAKLYMLGGMLLAVPFAFSSGWGVTTVSRCKEAAR